MHRAAVVLFSVLLAFSLPVRAASPVAVANAWARATVPGQMASGAFMTLTSPTQVKLVGVSTPMAGVAQVHEMAMQGTTMTMHASGALDLPAGRAVELKPGGYHVMLMDLKQPLKAGERIPITLRIEGADRKVSEQTISVEVMSTAPNK